MSTRVAVRESRSVDHDSPVSGSEPAAGIVEGRVIAQLPSGLYQVEIDGRRRITAHIGGGVERNFVRVLVGDRVTVEPTANDATRGRIIKKS